MTTSSLFILPRLLVLVAVLLLLVLPSPSSSGRLPGSSHQCCGRCVLGGAVVVERCWPERRRSDFLWWRRDRFVSAFAPPPRSRPASIPPSTPRNDGGGGGGDEEEEEDRADRRFMKLALEQAGRARARNEVPIGAVVVERTRRRRGRAQQRRRRQFWRQDAAVEDWDEQDRGGYRYEYRVLSRGHNRVETDHDASAHAELVALRRAGCALGNWRLGVAAAALAAGRSSRAEEEDDDDATYDTTVTLYSTLEPCIACWAAAHSFRIHRVVYGAPDLRLGAVTAFGGGGGENANNNSAAPMPLPDAHLLLQRHHPFHQLEQVKGGVEGERCAAILREFFRERRKKRKWRRPSPFRRLGSLWRNIVRR